MAGDTNGQADVHVADLGWGSSPSPSPDGRDPVGDPVAPPPPPASDPVAQPAGSEPIGTPVRGGVRVRARGARRFTRLRHAAPIADGTETDTRRGVLRLRGARISGPRPCPAGRKLLVRAGDTRIRTRAKRSTAAGRRSAWLTRDTCHGTVIKVLRGRVRRGDRYRVRSSQPRTAPQ